MDEIGYRYVQSSLRRRLGKSTRLRVNDVQHQDQSPSNLSQTGYRRAIELLHACATEHGFLATPTERDKKVRFLLGTWEFNTRGLLYNIVHDEVMLLPAFDPVITPKDEDWDDLQMTFSHTFKNAPHEYHNGGLWPLVTGIYRLVSMGQLLRSLDRDSKPGRQIRQYKERTP